MQHCFWKSSIYSRLYVYPWATSPHGLLQLQSKSFSINLEINQNVLKCARLSGVKKLVSCLSSTAYPVSMLEDTTEEQLNLGPPAASVSGYAHSKRILEFMTQCMREEHGVDFVTVCPTNIFGPKRNLRKDGPMFEANLAKCLEAKAAGEPYRCWGSGKPVRQLLYRCVTSHVVQVEDRLSCA